MDKFIKRVLLVLRVLAIILTLTSTIAGEIALSREVWVDLYWYPLYEVSLVSMIAWAALSEAEFLRKVITMKNDTPVYLSKVVSGIFVIAGAITAMFLISSLKYEQLGFVFIGIGFSIIQQTIPTENTPVKEVALTIQYES